MHNIEMTEYVRPNGKRRTTKFECGKALYDAWKTLCSNGVGVSCEYIPSLDQFILYVKWPWETEEQVIRAHTIPFEMSRLLEKYEVHCNNV